ncbi:MAG: hypothetical protein MJH10_21465, partial [Epibacterium sp.]|nr:hypothetical protein [Epibacterium sp.]NQX76017.1 hypothetical protein [Epibacterium sp.]
SAHQWQVRDKDSAKFFKTYIDDQVEQGNEVLYYIKSLTISDKQRNALHVLCRELAEKLNDAGVFIRHPSNEEIEVPFTMESVKLHYFKYTASVLYGTDSTEKLSTKQLTELVEIVLSRIAEVHNVVVFFPTRDFIES